RPRIDVAQLDAGPGGQPLDGLHEGEVVDVHHELDGVATRAAPMAVPGEDVVFENEGVRLLDDWAEDLLDFAKDLDTLDHPPPPPPPRRSYALVCARPATPAEPAPARGRRYRSRCVDSRKNSSVRSEPIRVSR